ncbi:MAG: DUF4013 domain-containing protein [Methanomicrobiales archaeon]|nr:DUF4013 domain-containing protein [Methanomicrobiales archaeon]
MDYGKIVGESFAYAKDAVVGKWMQWLLLVVATLLLCIPLMGYTVRVFRGDTPAPEVTGWGSLFIDGIKYLIISLIYALPSLVILFVTLGSALIAALSGNAVEELAGVEGLFFGMAIFIVVAVICGLFGMIGVIRFAKTGSMGEAFNFVEIKETIGHIGWFTYILAFVVMFIVQVVLAVILGIITMIPILGFIIEFVLVAPIAIFEARYFVQVYESTGASL